MNLELLDISILHQNYLIWNKTRTEWDASIFCNFSDCLEILLNVSQQQVEWKKQTAYWNIVFRVSYESITISYL